MGLFLAMSGIAGSTSEQMENALQDYSRQKGRRFEALATSPDTIDCLVISEAANQKVTVLYPGDFLEWDEVSSYLSSVLRAPVFSLHVHDGDLWMYVLFAQGEQIDAFNPLPEYWDDSISLEERAVWAGDVSIVSKIWPDIAAADIANYLIHWDLDALAEVPAKAYPDDKSSVGEDWQVSDFMKKLGLTYPMDELGNRRGKTFRFS